MDTLTQNTAQEKPNLLEIHEQDVKEIERIKATVGQPNENNWLHPQPLFEQIGTPA